MFIYVFFFSYVSVSLAILSNVFWSYSPLPNSFQIHSSFPTYPTLFPQIQFVKPMYSGLLYKFLYMYIHITYIHTYHFS